MMACQGRHETLINFLIENYSDASLFASNYEVLLANGKKRRYNFKYLGINTHGVISNFYEVSRNQSIYHHSCICIAKKVFEEVGYYNETINYGEDIDFMIRAHANHKLAYFNEALSTYRLDSENQITQAGIAGKKLPDYNYYEELFEDRNDIKKYIDFYRYTIAKQFKLLGNQENFQSIIHKIDSNNLTWKQRLLLRFPNYILKLISWFKMLLLRLGINITSY